MNTLWNIFCDEYPLEADTRENWMVWREIPDFDREAVLEGLRIWKNSDDWADPRYIPNAVNFLRREQWKKKPRSYQNRTTPRRPGEHIPNYDSDAYRRKAQDPGNYVYHKRGG